MSPWVSVTPCLHNGDMTEQLALSVPKGSAAPSRHATRRIRIVPPVVDHRLDEHTREVGRQGVAAARAALAAANQRANARVAERQAEREAELTRQASATGRRRHAA